MLNSRRRSGADYEGAWQLLVKRGGGGGFKCSQLSMTPPDHLIKAH